MSGWPSLIGDIQRFGSLVYTVLSLSQWRKIIPTLYSLIHWQLGCPQRWTPSCQATSMVSVWDIYLDDLSFQQFLDIYRYLYFTFLFRQSFMIFLSCINQLVALRVKSKRELRVIITVIAKHPVTVKTIYHLTFLDYYLNTN